MLDKPLFIAVLPLITFVVLFILQWCFPRRIQVNKPKYLFSSKRQLNNILLFAFNSLMMTLVYIVAPLSLMFAAHWAQEHQFGLFNLFGISEHWLVIILTIILLDFAVYWQHVATHKINWLWRFHKVHHSDLEMDITTAVRFHIIELVLSQLYKVICILLLGASLWAVIVFELLLLLGAQFSHSNWRISSSLDNFIRTIIVTPDVHRIHHSVHRTEHDTNYGFFLILWDKVFGTYTCQPSDGHEGMEVGLGEFRMLEIAEAVQAMVVMPFKK